MPLPRDREQGFTLVELMVVVVIVGALAAIAMPSFNKTLRDSVVRKRTRQAAEIFHQFRGDAAATGRAMFIRFEGKVGAGGHTHLAKAGITSSCIMPTGFWDGTGYVYEDVTTGDEVAVIPQAAGEADPTTGTAVIRCVCIRPSGMLFTVDCTTGGSGTMVTGPFEIHVDDVRRGFGTGFVVQAGVNSLAKVYTP